MSSSTITKYLVISANESRYGSLRHNVRMVEKAPKLKGNEVSVRISINLPDALFKRPELVAKLDVPASAVRDIHISPDVTDNIEKIIKEATGLTVSINVIEHPEDKKNDDDN